jgi:hypothetical protein
LRFISQRQSCLEGMTPTLQSLFKIGQTLRKCACERKA